MSQDKKGKYNFLTEEEIEYVYDPVNAPIPVKLKEELIKEKIQKEQKEKHKDKYEDAQNAFSGGNMSLLFGILSFLIFCLGIPLAIGGVVYGFKNTNPHQKGRALVGKIISLFVLVVHVLFIVAMIYIFMFLREAFNNFIDGVRIF